MSVNQGLPAIERFRMKYRVADNGCWEWVGSNTGTFSGQLVYGRFYAPQPGGPRAPLAHRWSYEYHVGPIPHGLQLDHLCRNTLCVNPAHLEPVTSRENVIRGTSPNAVNAKKTHCVNGHPLTKENCYTTKWPRNRECKTCAQEASRRRTAERRAERNRAA